MAASFVFNALEAAGLIVWMTTKQRLIPGRLLGRVSSLDWFISIGLVPISFALTGPVAAAFGVRATLVGAGLIGAAITFAFLFLPGMRAIEGLASDPDDAEPDEIPAPRGRRSGSWPRRAAPTPPEQRISFSPDESSLMSSPGFPIPIR